MTNRLTLDRFFDQFDASTVGFGPVFKEFQTPMSNYPPHNIISVSDDEAHLELAVAGFKKDEIQIEEHRGILTIKGDKKDDKVHTYQYRGIATRSFSKSFRLAEYFEVDSATVEDGILDVKLIRNVPESAKPKTIMLK